jgi:HD-GYP domain-containing protein (c-di-GMP phosphodiesterase class II)
VVLIVPEHLDLLASLNKHIPLKEKLDIAHSSINKLYPFVSRISVTLYDQETTMLKTYLHSSHGDNPLEHYQALIDDAPSLKIILEQGAPRVINDLLTFEHGEHEHTKRIGRQGYAASYTLPMFNEGVFFGFIFFNSKEKNSFTENALRYIDTFAHLISLMVINELTAIHTLTAAIKTTGHITHCRDPETGSHLDRMSRYSRLIAAALAEKYDMDDEYIEHIFMFAPLHDIGKIAVPDEILLKPEKLNDTEMAVMKMHARKGREMIDELIENFGLQNFKHIDVLRNIAEYHHEAIDGSGYPEGKKMDEIPIEARIVAVAVVFDALTSKRPYKEAWSNDQAVKTLEQQAGVTLDADCVKALVNNFDQVTVIQQQFIEDNIG